MGVLVDDGVGIEREDLLRADLTEGLVEVGEHVHGAGALQLGRVGQSRQGGELTLGGDDVGDPRGRGAAA